MGILVYFLIMGNAGSISSTVAYAVLGIPSLHSCTSLGFRV